MSNGPNHSVPQQIRAQAACDRVFWYNLSDVCRDEWRTDDLYCHTIREYPDGDLGHLPAPFCDPDLIVFEEVYKYLFNGIALAAQRRRIPYVVVPRSSMTRGAQSRRWYKKVAGNILWFNRFIKRSAGVQFLTEEELNESKAFRVNGFIVPNGFTVPPFVRRERREGPVRMTYVGRIRLYQKGLEKMIEAAAVCAGKGYQSRFRIDLYGTDFDNAVSTLNQMIADRGLTGTMEIHGAVYHEQKDDVLRNSDIFIMTSDFEGMPMGLIEALANGLPAVATRGTNMMDAIASHDAGWAAGSTVPEIAGAMMKAIDEREQIAGKGANAHSLAQTYDWRDIAKKSHEIYETLIRR